MIFLTINNKEVELHFLIKIWDTIMDSSSLLTCFPLVFCITNYMLKDCDPLKEGADGGGFCESDHAETFERYLAIASRICQYLGTDFVVIRYLKDRVSIQPFLGQQVPLIQRASRKGILKPSQAENRRSSPTKRVAFVSTLPPDHFIGKPTSVRTNRELLVQVMRAKASAADLYLDIGDDRTATIRIGPDGSKLFVRESRCTKEKPSVALTAEEFEDNLQARIGELFKEQSTYCGFKSILSIFEISNAAQQMPTGITLHFETLQKGWLEVMEYLSGGARKASYLLEDVKYIFWVMAGSPDTGGADTGRDILQEYELGSDELLEWFGRLGKAFNRYWPLEGQTTHSILEGIFLKMKTHREMSISAAHMKSFESYRLGLDLNVKMFQSLIKRYILASNKQHWSQAREIYKSARDEALGIKYEMQNALLFTQALLLETDGSISKEEHRLLLLEMFQWVAPSFQNELTGAIYSINPIETYGADTGRELLYLDPFSNQVVRGVQKIRYEWIATFSPFFAF